MPEGGSVRIRSLATGLVEEAFLDERGGFFAGGRADSRRPTMPLELTVCDAAAVETAATSTIAVRHTSQARRWRQAVLPTQLITKPLQIEVLQPRPPARQTGRRPGRRHAAGRLPAARCRTHDQAGRIVVPIFEENRIIKQMVIADLDPPCPSARRSRWSWPST